MPSAPKGQVPCWNSPAERSGNEKVKYLKDLRIYIQLLLAGISIWFIVRLVLFGMMTNIQYVIAFFITAAFNLLVYVLMFARHKKRKKLYCRIGKALGIAFSVFLAVMALGMWFMDSFLHGITGTEVVKKDISFIVLEDSPIQSQGDISGDALAAVQQMVTDEDIQELCSEIVNGGGSAPETVPYESLNGQIEALYSGEADAVIINESSRSLIEEQWEDFSSDTRVVVSVSVSREQANISRKTDVTAQPFLVLISGMDAYGSLDQTARSDVNILAAVDPVEAKILLVSIPRDYYVPIMSGNTSIAGRDGSMDKLTHSGLFGAECTVRTLENFFDVEINYYVKVNFSSVIEIVDAIGGITVESDIAFGEFRQGSNECSGEQALAFVRERYAFADGDRQRGRNQMEVIRAIVSKLSDPSLSYDYAALLETVQDSVDMNFSDTEVKSLIQMELARRPAWQVESISVNGEDGNDYSYFYGSDLYVMYPDMDSVEEAKDKISEIMEQ